MTPPTSSLASLSTKLCPWLRPAFERLGAAHRSARLGHAWLIAGPAGIGKINLALAFADRLFNGSGGSEPTQLEPGEALAALAERHTPADHHPDLHWLYPEEDKHSISVEQVRDAIEALSLTAHRGAAKVVIVEPADAMTTAAANALLKTLEEPSGDTYLLLLSHQPGRLAATIRSRCQRIDLPRPSIEALSDWLVGSDPEAVAAVWRMTGGAPLAATATLLGGAYNENKGLLDIVSEVCEDKIDPQRAADAWFKADTTLALTWLTRQLHAEISNRLGGEVSTGITDQTGATLHNAWRNLTLRALFSQYEKAERLLNQQGSGINVELALQAIFCGFSLNRGRV